LQLNATELQDPELKDFILFGNYKRTKVSEYSYYATRTLNDKILFILVNGSPINSEQIALDLNQLNISNKTNKFSYRSDYLNLNSQMLL